MARRPLSPSESHIRSWRQARRNMSDAQREYSIHSAFMGSATLPFAGADLYVHALCWSNVPTAWRSMSQAWESVGSWRDELSAPTRVLSPSWVAECAPQLGSPFRGATSEESTIAALLTRAPMSIALSVLDGAQALDSMQRDGMLNCLSSYDKYINVPGRLPCRMLVARGDDEKSHTDAFARSRRRLPDAKWLQNMELRCWMGAVEPLPLEIAHVIAASVARFRIDGDMANPIAEAVSAKLAHPLELLRGLPRKRR